MAFILPEVGPRFKKLPVYLGLVTLIIALIAAAYSLWTNKDLISGKLGIGPEIVAKVEGENILKSDYETRLAAQKYFYTTFSKLPQEELNKIESRVLEEFIQEILLKNFLAKSSINITDDEVRQKIKETSVDRLFGGSWSEYENSLKNTYHTSLSEVIRTVRIEILKDKVSSLKTEKHIFAIWVSKEVPQFVSYEAMTDELRSELVKANKSKKEKAEELLQKVNNGEDFADLARKSSEDKESADNGGDLGFLYEPKYINKTGQKTFDSFPDKSAVLGALNELESGKVKMYETFIGYGVIKVTEVKEGPLGNQSFEEWYPGFRDSSDVKIF
jgi:hypothetical protein